MNKKELAILQNIQHLIQQLDCGADDEEQKPNVSSFANRMLALSKITCWRYEPMSNMLFFTDEKGSKKHPSGCSLTLFLKELNRKDRQNMLDAFHRLLTESCEEITFTFAKPFKNGQHWYEVHACRYEKCIIGTMCLLRHEDEQAQKALQDKQKFELLMSIANVFVWEYDCLLYTSANVLGVAEIMPYSNGLNRNIVQCLKDFAIPLYLSHTIVDIQGDFHVERVVIAQVDEHRNILPKTQKSFAVDTLLLSIGLLPEMSLADHLDMEMDSKSKGAKVNAHYETSIPHIYACGNALHVHDIVDFVSMEAHEAALCAVQDIKGQYHRQKQFSTQAGSGISYVLPHSVDAQPSQNITLCVRSIRPYKQVMINIRTGDRIIKTITKRYLLPSEMERIILKPSDIGILEESLIVEVKES